jgi:hypothetical protein
MGLASAILRDGRPRIGWEEMTDAPRRFIARSHRVKRATWVLAVTLSMAAVVSLTLAARNGGHAQGGDAKVSKTARSAGSLPGLSAAFVRAVNLTDVRVVAASQTPPVTVTEQSAVAAVRAQLPSGSSVSAGDLVTLNNAQHPDGVLAWAIESTGSFTWVSGGPVGIRRTAGAQHSRPPTPNFRVDFVDASTGAWLEGVSGYSPGL